jgi:hypothetical protein
LNWYGTCNITPKQGPTKALIRFDYVTPVNSWFGRHHVPSAFLVLGMRTKVLPSGVYLFIFARWKPSGTRRARSPKERHNKITVPTTSKFNSRRIRRSLSYTLDFLSHPQGFADIRKQFSDGIVGCNGTTANFILLAFFKQQLLPGKYRRKSCLPNNHF